MKTTYAVAALAAGANAASIHHRHAHDALHALEKKSNDNSTCGCTTIYSTYYGQPTLVFPSVPAAAPTTSSSAAPTTLTQTQVVVPTPVAQTCSTTGVYTFPATTVTLTDSTTVAVPTTTAVTSGTNVVGGVTTIVSTATTVTCPYATVSTSEGVTTSVIETTTYVCPSAGTYTIAPITTTVTEDTTVTVPCVTSYTPGTYTQPEVVTTITETSTVVYCPFDVPTPTAETTSVAPVTTSAAPVTTSAVETSAVETYPVVTSSVETSAATATEYPTSSSKAPAPTGGLGGAAGQPWGVTYTPYTTDSTGECKSQSVIEADIAAIAAAGITTIRVYSTDCHTLDWVAPACDKSGVKLIVGIFIDTAGCDASNPSVQEQIDLIAKWANWDQVDLITVGNEAVLHGYCTPAELAALVTKAKSAFTGYTGPFSTSETVNIWQQEEFTSAMCPVIDVVGANAHAFFNQGTDASEAGAFVKSQLDIINKACAGLEGYIMETGWPTKGNAMGKAVPGVSEQEIAIKSIVAAVGDKAVMFSLTSDAWKDENTDCGCEQHWGCASVLGITL
ncbi:Uu.00g045610.m01.CDS01 [Anthostomella pinea]|uniref:Probable beta-glucosidase btgE n=1 Tax=Anthostomella pinea TaxID=933095 RepID=A0AAI8YEJ8_9PEZI|nr:Uu.00g045610.m01.CDS01 [Anthostomella pinea]